MIRIATVTPVPSQEPNAHEQSSLRALKQQLGRWENIAVVPPGRKVSGFITCQFPAKWFCSPASLNELFLTRGFYQCFRSYDYVLMVHLDSPIWTSQPETFCGYDYLAPPSCRGSADGKPILAGPGPGKFSLRRVASFLAVFDAARRKRRWRPLAAGRLGDEGYFWARRAAYVYPPFRIAPPAVALAFGGGWQRTAEFQDNPGGEAGRLPAKREETEPPTAMAGGRKPRRGSAVAELRFWPEPI